MARILVIDTDISLATVLTDYLSSRNYQAQFLTSGKAALELMEHNAIDVVLTELHVDAINGFDLIREIRRRSPRLPLVVLTARSEREAQIRAFQLGADDYVTKPFSMDILICRIEAILRRVREHEENKQKVFDLNGHTFNAVRETFDGEHMSSREAALLLMLCRREGEVVDKHAILAALWKEDNAFTARSLGVFINHLRRYLTPAGYSIIAVRYKGYKLVSNEHP
ncbi:MAG: response regulator transcription factor [Paludibacteraceae bacterium]|nr:response regulator transcription factor [Paludibacteraceae bacterium]